MFSSTLPKSDIVGALASGLCVVHCIATPFLFVAQSCSVSGCCSEASPTWWSSIDYLFIGITLLAVYYSGKSTGKAWMKHALYASWAILSIIVVNEKFGFFPIAEFWKYLMAGTLISMHFYNLKYCQCADEACCVA